MRPRCSIKKEFIRQINNSDSFEYSIILICTGVSVSESINTQLPVTKEISAKTEAMGHVIRMNRTVT